MHLRGVAWSGLTPPEGYRLIESIFPGYPCLLEGLMRDCALSDDQPTLLDGPLEPSLQAPRHLDAECEWVRNGFGIAAR
jgi:hypothetical protein